MEALLVVKNRGVDIDQYTDAQAFTMQTPEQVLESFKTLFIDTPIGQRVIKAGHHKHAVKEMQQYYLDILQTGNDMGISMPTLNSFQKTIATRVAEFK